MAYINLVMGLPDFFEYIGDILKKEHGIFLIEHKNKAGTIVIEEMAPDSVPPKIENTRDQHLGFFILSALSDSFKKSTLYDDDTAPVVIKGEGGRITTDSIERISLRVLSKTPDKHTKKIFNSIKSKLKKDPNIKMGVEGGSKFHDDYFYQADQVEKRVFITDFYNIKAPIIKVKTP